MYFTSPQYGGMVYFHEQDSLERAWITDLADSASIAFDLIWDLSFGENFGRLDTGDYVPFFRAVEAISKGTHLHADVDLL